MYCAGGALARAPCPVVMNAQIYPFHTGHTVVSSCLLPQHGCAESLETWLPSSGRLPAWVSIILTLTSTRGISYLIACYGGGGKCLGGGTLGGA